MVHGQAVKKTHLRGHWHDVGPDCAVRQLSSEVDKGSLNDFLWETGGNLCDLHHVAVCPFGGPIAVAERENHANVIYLHPALPSSSPLSAIRIGVVETEDGTSVVIAYLCWNIENDQLIVALSDGAVHFFDTKGDRAAASVKVHDPVLFCGTETGLACVTRQNTAVLVSWRVEGRYVVDEVAVPISGPTDIAAFTVVSRSRNKSETGYDELILTAAAPSEDEHATFFLAVFGAKPSCRKIAVELPPGSVVQLAVAPTKPRVAMILEDGRIFAGSADFRFVHEVGNTQTPVQPAQLFWIGDDVIAYVFLNGQFDEEEQFPTTISAMPYPGDQHSAPGKEPSERSITSLAAVCEIPDLPKDAFVAVEVDGVRIISSDTFQMLQVVPASVRSALGVGSPSAAALLVKAHDEFAEESADSIDFIGRIAENTAEMCGAVDEVVEAAGFEMEAEAQKRLLRVASFGKSFCSSYPSDNFVNMCRRLRILHSVRSVGHVLTLQQLVVLEGDRLAQRLVAAGHFQMAFEVAQLLDMPVDGLLRKWSLALIASSKAPDDEIAHRIIDKYNTTQRRVSFVDVASFASAKGRVALAMKLLDAEPSADNQIQLLLEMHQEEKALRWAVASGSPDLIFRVMLEMLVVRRAEAFRTINAIEEAASILRQYILVLLFVDPENLLCTEYTREFPEFRTQVALLDYFKHHDRMERKNKGLSPSPASDEVLQQFKASAVQTAEDAAKWERGSSTSIRLLHLQQNLLDEQTRLSQVTASKAFLSASLSDTIRLCYVHNRPTDAEQLAKLFAAPERMVAWARLRAYVQSCNWSAIEQMAGAKKAPVFGFEPFVQVLMEADRPQEAAKYVPKLSPIEYRLEMYVACADWKGACEDCIRSKEPGMLAQLKSRARSDHIVELIDSYIRRAGSSGGGGFSRLF